MTAIAWVLIASGIAAIIAGFHKRTLWGAISAWLSGKPINVTTKGGKS